MSVKKSNFTADTVIPDASTLDFVSPGTNLKITFANFKTVLGIGNGLNTPNIVETGLDYDVLVTDDYIIGSGTITVKFPLRANATKPFYVKNDGVGTITLDGNGSTVPGASTISTTVARLFVPKSGGWAEF